MAENNKNNPLISVIIPCYNAEKYVEQAVRSVMTQTYKNLEILCCDDCSTDSTLQILQKLAAEDSRIKVIHNEENLRLIDTLNKLVSLATGDFIARMDSDDICLPERLERQYSYILQNPSVDLCGCNAFHINEQDKIIGKSCLPLKYDDCRFFLIFYSTFYHPTIFAKAQVLKQNPYDKEFIHAEDYELWCRLIFEKGLKGENLREKLIKYRINPNGISLQNAKLQAENSSRIFDKYKIVPNEIVEKHKNVFFLHKKSKLKLEIKSIKSEIEEIKKRKISYSSEAYKKYLFHVKKWESFSNLLKAVFCPVGFVSVLKILRKKYK